MKISIVINTCAKGASEEPGGYDLSSMGKPYGLRYEVLRNQILPRYSRIPHGPDEIIVAGEFEPGDDWTYIEAPSEYNDARDALHQRQAGAEVATGNLVVFQHDDHYLRDLFWRNLRENAVVFETHDLLNPIRACWRDGSARRHNVNEGCPDYISGHFVVMTREALETVPWKDVSTEKVNWDQSHTDLCDDRLYRWAKAPMLVAFDVEIGEMPPDG